MRHLREERLPCHFSLQVCLAARCCSGGRTITRLAKDPNASSMAAHALVLLSSLAAALVWALYTLFLVHPYMDIAKALLGLCIHAWKSWLVWRADRAGWLEMTHLLGLGHEHYELPGVWLLDLGTWPQHWHCLVTGPQPGASRLQAVHLTTQLIKSLPFCLIINPSFVSRHIQVDSVPVGVSCHCPFSAITFIYLVTAPMAGPPPNPVKWQCHVCNGGPYLWANTTRCTNIMSNNLPCNHDFCHAHCKKDNDIPPPLSSPQSSIPGLRCTSNRSRSTLPATLLGNSNDVAAHSRTHGLGGGLAHPSAGNHLRKHRSSGCISPRRPVPRNNDAQCRSRPSMRGWWICCGCRNLNNPALCGGRCTVCGHPGPCPSCTSPP